MASTSTGSATSSSPEASRLEELRLTAEEGRIEAEVLAGSTPTVGDVELLCEMHPYRERLWGLLARSLYRDHRQAEARHSRIDLDCSRHWSSSI